jgi:ABC-type multidrug transport system fused ATPase/permease subunit
VYWRYIKAGTLSWWFVVIIVMILFRVLDTGQTWFIKAWGESYNPKVSRTIFDFLPPASENVIPWLQTFFVFVAATSILFWWVYLIMFGVGYQAAKVVFQEAIGRVAHATFRYYDVTPVGRLMNRLTSDMNTVDGGLSQMFTVFVWQAIGWLTAVTIILTSTPAFLVFGIVLCCAFVYYFFRFLPTSQSLRRLEVSRIERKNMSHANGNSDGIAFASHV